MPIVHEITKIEKDAATGLYCIKLLSTAIGEWMVVAEWPTLEQAKADQKEWRRGVEVAQAGQGG